MNTDVTFATGNEGKWQIARDIFEGYGIGLLRENIETPEMQSLDVVEIARASARYAADRLGRAVIKSDVGYYIPALGGFPGPFVKFVNMTLTPENILDMMRGEDDRRIYIRECLAFAMPGAEPRPFVCEHLARIAEAPDGRGTSVDRITIFDGFARTKGAAPEAEVQAFLRKSLDVYHNLARFLLRDRETGK